MIKYLKVAGICFVAVIIAILTYGIEKTILGIQDVVGIAEQIKINNVVINRPKGWMLSHSKEETDGSEGSRIYGMINTKEEPAFRHYYAFVRPDSKGKVVLFGKMDTDSIDKIRKHMSKLEQGELAYNKVGQVTDVFGYKAFVLEMPKYNSYNVSIISLGLNIQLPSLDLLNEFDIQVNENISE